MVNNCINESIPPDENLLEGLRILARIIARDFLSKNDENEKKIDHEVV